MVARTPAEVVAGEATFGSGQWEDMLGVASVIDNRARQLGVTPQQVVARQSEFNAYGKPLPKGQAKNVALAEKALRHVQEFGPVHHGTFFATPATTGNLPRGLSRITQTKGHVYFSDPQRRPINTAAGTKPYRNAPAPIATAYAPQPKPTGAVAAIDRAMAPRSIPTPTTAPRGPATSLPAEIGGRVLAKPANPPTPTPAPFPTGAPAASRFGSPQPQTMAPDMRNRLAEAYGVKGGRVPDPSVSASTIARPTTRPSYSPPSTFTAAQAQNLADRLSPQTSLAMAPRPTNAPRAVSVSAPASVQQAASLPAGLRAAPPSTPRAVSVAAPASVQRAASLPAGLQASRVSPAVAADRAVSAVAPDGIARAASLPSGLQSARNARVAPASVSRATPLTTKQAVNLASRLGPMTATVGAAELREARKAAPPAPATSLLGVTPAAAATRTPTTVATPAAATPSRPNFAGPAGSIRSMDTRTAAATAPQRSVPTPTSRPAPTTNFAGRVGSPRAVEGAMAAARPVAAPISRPSSLAATAPARTNFAGPDGSIRSLDARPTINPASPPSLAPAPAYRSSVPGPISSPMAHYSTPVSAISSVPTPTSRPQIQGPMRPAGVAASMPSRIATPTARPAIAAPASIGPITSRPAPAARAISAPAAVARSIPTPTARDPWGGLGTGVVSPAAAVQAAPQPAGIASRLGLTPGRIAGSVIGGLALGPVGAIAGGWLGGRIAGPAAPGPAQSSMGSFGGIGGMNGMGNMGGFGTQGSSLNGAGMAGGNRDRTGSFSGFGERDSAVGTDGGKVGGTSKSSSSSGGKSSSSGGKGKK